jgi:DNA repair protein RecO (recombination protein O)
MVVAGLRRPLNGITMSSEKSLALVLRVVDFSETSCVVTLFTRDFGKISALAKGARRPRSSFESALDLLAICRIVFLHKSSDTLDLLTEAKLDKRFRAAQRDLSRLYAGYYVVELPREMTDEGDPHPFLFDVAIQTMADLDGSGPVAATVLRFEILTLSELGHMPSFDGCASCGKSLKPTRRLAFGQLAGGLLCPQCREGQKQVVSVTSDAIQVLKQFAEIQSDEWRRLEIDARVRGEIRGLISQYICNLLGHRPRMHRFLGFLAGGSS